jgi:hypothetical protein
MEVVRAFLQWQLLELEVSMPPEVVLVVVKVLGQGVSMLD